jgi:acetyl-CoA acetyltransferase
MARTALTDATAVVGIGETTYAKQLTDDELTLACEAVLLALDDAGLTPADVDGVTQYTMQSFDETHLARAVGFGDLTFFANAGYGGGAGCSTVGLAAMAVATGQADCVVAYRSRKRGDKATRVWAQGANVLSDHWKWSRPYGLLRPVDEVAILARRYFHEFGATRDQLANVALAMRFHAQSNPRAMMYGRPMTTHDYFAARWISEPLCLYDNCLESDGAAALVICSRERARDLRQPPAVIHAVAQGLPRQMQIMTNYHGDDPLRSPSWAAGPRLWATSDVGPDDVQVCQFYDAFSPLVFLQLEGFGFCGRGEAGPFSENGALELGGRLPINTAGGSLSECYLHGFNLIVEAVQQIRGRSTNQVDGCEVSMATSAEAVPTGAVIFRSDR